MPVTAEQYIRANDNASDYADHLIEGMEQLAAEDIDELIRNDRKRNEELWAQLGVTPDSVISDYDAIEPDDRDLDWTEGLAGMSAAASHQVFLEQREDTIVRPVAYREQVVGALVVSSPIIVEAARRGVELQAQARFAKLQATYLNELSFVRDLSDVELYDLLMETRSLRPFDKYVADQMGYVSRMTSLKPGDPRYTEEVARLVDANAKGTMQSMNRRSVERLYTQRETGGNVNQDMVWVGEGGPRACSACVSNYGEVLTYAEWAEQGLPGSAVCLGGDRCRCHLAAV